MLTIGFRDILAIGFQSDLQAVVRNTDNHLVDDWVNDVELKSDLNWCHRYRNLGMFSLSSLWRQHAEPLRN